MIGGGLVGIEAVEVAVAAGLRPHFFMREEWFWPIALDRTESRWISERMAQHGVEVHLEHEVEALETDPDGNVSAVRTNLGRYEADCVVIGIGVIPNTGWLADTGIELDDGGGIVVDEGLQTSAPEVFAAGDCASVRWFDGTRRPEQLWYTARDQGRVAGRRLLGDSSQYERGTWYNSAKLMDIEYTTAGLVNWELEREENWFFEEEGKVCSTTRVVVQDGHVVGFNMLGRRWDHTVLIRWIKERRTLEWVLRHVSDASARSLLGFVQDVIAPSSIVHTDGWSGYRGLESLGYRHVKTTIKRSGKAAHELMPRVHRVASLLKRWLLGTHQGGVQRTHLEYYLDEFPFRFNRRKSRAPGMLFYRLLQQSAGCDPVPYSAIVGGGSGHRGITESVE